ncbi:cytosolic carboxypeptidase 6-like isoform x1 [Plakobranchus ocellatus]|uniref:Cytosolic carboxypeptidase 6-like isoform x1 n=1 Tax=Plakobranchus ocellatus TaxID=259542 RepID=A0AAV4BRR9_9GAST|nr:cytosolic carboxypeptidase 6-like isoform x1 [Plakobranchus ocellatus]
MKLGRNLARTFLDYYKLTGFISAKPSSSLVPKISGGQGGNNGMAQGGQGFRGARTENGRTLESNSCRPHGDTLYSNRKEERLGRKPPDYNARAGSSYSDLPSQQAFPGQARDSRRL